MSAPTRPLLRRSAACLSALTLAALTTGGCDDLAQQLQSEHVAIAALVKVPEQVNPKDGTTKVPGLTTFTLFFGKVDSKQIVLDAAGKKTASEGSFSGLAQAKVTLELTDAQGQQQRIGIPDKGGGKYVTDSSESQLLTYSTRPYTATIVHAGKTYRLKVTPPQATTIKEFQDKPAKIVRDWEPGQPFTVTRAQAKGAANNPIAFVGLSSVDGAKESETWSNVPKDALGMLRLALDDGEWRADSFTIPGDQFRAQTGYLVTMSALERGTGTTEGGASALFVGSSFFAGVADGGGVLTK